MDDKEIDQILSEKDDFSPIDLAMDQVENIGGDVEDVKPEPMVFDDLPQLQGTDYPIEFTNMVDRILVYYRMLPHVNYIEIMEELAGLTVESVPTPTLQLINQELQKVQAVKERISEIMRVVLPSHTMKKRHLELLKESWLRFSSGKASDQRKADAVFRFAQFESDYAATDALMKTAMHVAKNMDSIQDILSRRITIVSLELKMMDLGRHGLPDYSFSSPSLSSDSLKSDNQDFAEDNDDGYDDGPLEADEMSF